MSRKRKSEATTGLDEVDRTVYSTFCSAANSISQLYAQVMNQQKISFQAGERHALEKLHQWIMREHEDESRVTVADIVAHIQNEMDHPGEDASRTPFQNQLQQTTMHSANSVIQPPSNFFGQPTVELTPRSGLTYQAKSSVFTNAFSSPVRRSLQPFHIADGSRFSHSAGDPGARNHDLNQHHESDSLTSNGSAMEIQTYSPAHE